MPLTLSYADASKAFNEVLTVYANYLPTQVVNVLRTKTIKDLYEICDAGKYATKFDITWNRTFKKANAQLYPGKVFAAGSVPAFTTDEPYIIDRKVYLQDGVVQSWGTYYHEAIHLLQHRDVYPTFYSTGGNAPFQMEGLTELLTRDVSGAVKNERQTRGNYKNEFLKAEAAVTGKSGLKEILVNVNFRGTGRPSTESSAAIVNLLMDIIP